MKIKGLFSVMLHKSYFVGTHWNIIVDTYRNPFSETIPMGIHNI